MYIRSAVGLTLNAGTQPRTHPAQPTVHSMRGRAVRAYSGTVLCVCNDYLALGSYLVLG